jgi:hypothetical protein
MCGWAEGWRVQTALWRILPLLVSRDITRAHQTFPSSSNGGPLRSFYTGRTSVSSLTRSRIVRKKPHPLVEANLLLSDSRKPWISRTLHVHWADLRHLIEREWTKRVWTCQEILLASRPVLVCGNAHVPWEGSAKDLLFLSHGE